MYSINHFNHFIIRKILLFCCIPIILHIYCFQCNVAVAVILLGCMCVNVKMQHLERFTTQLGR